MGLLAAWGEKERKGMITYPLRETLVPIAVDPQIVILQKQVEDLQDQLAALEAVHTITPIDPQFLEDLQNIRAARGETE